MEMFFRSRMKPSVFGDSDSEEEEAPGGHGGHDRAFQAPRRPLCLRPDSHEGETYDYMVYDGAPNEDDGLETAALPSNSLHESLFDTNKDPIGLQMMQKMGYSKGTPLGSKSDGISEPLQVAVKRDRQGIGAESLQRSEHDDKGAAFQNYTASKSAKNKERHQAALLHNLQRVAFSLSGEADAYYAGQVKIEDINPLWRDYALRLAEEGQCRNTAAGASSMASNNPGDNSASLIFAVIEYLRARNYCYFCGCQYVKGDLARLCPGFSEEDHL